MMVMVGQLNGKKETKKDDPYSVRRIGSSAIIPVDLL